MGLFDFFSSGNKIERCTKRMLNEHHQQQVRQESMEELASYGTPEAVAALIKRLGANFRDTIKNEQEKRWVADTLVEHFPDKAIEPLIAFVRNEQMVSSAIQTLGRLVSAERLVGVLVETLAAYAPDDHRTIEARMQLVDALSDHLDDARALPVLCPYAMDHDDQIRVKVIGLLQQHVTPAHPIYAEVVNQLAAVLEDPEASARITRTAAEALITLEANLSHRQSALAESLPDGYRFNAEGKVARA
jgi:HEAT repeat protein